jgi:hypothetical protein
MNLPTPEGNTLEGEQQPVDFVFRFSIAITMVPFRGSSFPLVRDYHSRHLRAEVSPRLLLFDAKTPR